MIILVLLRRTEVFHNLTAIFAFWICYNKKNELSIGQTILTRGIICYNKKQMAKKITLENLAGMIKRGFDGVDKSFDENTKQHQQIFTKLEEITLKLNQVAYRFEVQELDRRLKRVETKLGIK